MHTQTPAIACHKCGGTGSVPFAHKDGVCFDCGGTGRYAAERAARRSASPINSARTLAAVAIESGDHDDALVALAAFDAIFRGQWKTSDYELRNQLASL